MSRYGFYWQELVIDTTPSVSGPQDVKPGLIFRHQDLKVPQLVIFARGHVSTIPIGTAIDSRNLQWPGNQISDAKRFARDVRRGAITITGYAPMMASSIIDTSGWPTFTEMYGPEF
jgi:hypothetical protein